MRRDSKHRGGDVWGPPPRITTAGECNQYCARFVTFGEAYRRRSGYGHIGHCGPKLI